MSRSPYVSALQEINRTWMTVLNPTEYRVLMFVVERTLRWNKDTEVIVGSHFINGITSADGELIIGGIPCSISSIRKAYTSLKERGLLSISKIDVGYTFKNKFTVHVAKLLRGVIDMVSKLKEPKQNQRGRTKRTMGVNERTRGGERENQRGTLPDPVEYTDSKQPDSKQPESSTSVADICKGVVHAHKQKQQQRAKKVENVFNAKNATAAWNIALQEHCPNAARITLSRQDAIVLKSVWKANHVNATLTEFMQWAVINWEDLRTNDLKWADTLSASPSLRSFAYLYKHFAASFSNTKARQAIRKRREAGTLTAGQRQQLEGAHRTQRENTELRGMLANQMERNEALTHLQHDRAVTGRRSKRKRTPTQEVADLDFASTPRLEE